MKIIKITMICKFMILLVYNAHATELIDLSLDQATELALENSVDIQALKYEIDISKNISKRSKSVFDIYLNGAANYTENKKMLVPGDSGSYTNMGSYSLGLSKKIKTGTTFIVDAEQTYVDDYLYDERDSAELNISIKQSLGKNFFGLQDRGKIDILDISSDLLQLISLDSIEEQIAKVQKAYWFLSLQDEFLNINKKMYNQALELYNIYEEKKAQGAAEEADFLAIKANLKNREKSVLLSVLNRDKAKNNLLALLNHDDMSLNIKSSNLIDVSSSSYNLIKGINDAMVNRRDYKSLLLKANQNDIDIKMKKASLWPQIDLLASYGANGIDKSSRESWENVTNKGDDRFFVGLSFSISLNNSAAKTDNSDAKLLAKKIIAQTRSKELLIIRQITNSINSLNTLKTELALAKEIMEIQSSKLLEEEKRVQFGRSNVDILVRYQDDARLAEMTYQETLYRLLVSQIDHSVYENSLLSKYVSNL